MSGAGFKSTARKGFHITFENGWTVSVQWGPGNYCDNYAARFDLDGRTDWESSTAEVAAWPAEGDWYQFEHGDTVDGHRSPAEVLAFVNMVAGFAPSNEVSGATESDQS